MTDKESNHGKSRKSGKKQSTSRSPEYEKHIRSRSRSIGRRSSIGKTMHSTRMLSGPTDVPLDSWENVLRQMETGKFSITNIPKGRFFWRTTPLRFQNGKIIGKFQHEIVPDHRLDRIRKCDGSSFRSHFENSVRRGEKMAVFWNMDQTCKLFVPLMQQGENMTTLSDFLRTASVERQLYFWKMLAWNIREFAMANGNANTYVSTHGLGVSYLHVRICTEGKYYPTNSPLLQFRKNNKKLKVYTVTGTKT